MKMTFRKAICGEGIGPCNIAERGLKIWEEGCRKFAYELCGIGMSAFLLLVFKIWWVGCRVRNIYSLVYGL